MANAELTDPFLVAFRDRIRSALDGSDIAILSATPMQYRLRIVFSLDGQKRSLDFHFDGTPKWTRVEEVGGAGSSRGLIERIHHLLGLISK